MTTDVIADLVASARAEVDPARQRIAAMLVGVTAYRQWTLGSLPVCPFRDDEPEMTDGFSVGLRAADNHRPTDPQFQFVPRSAARTHADYSSKED